MVNTDRNCRGPDALLHADGRVDRQRERDVLPERVVQQDRSTAARRIDRAERTRGAGRRQPRHVDRSDQRQPHDRRARRRRLRSRQTRGRTLAQQRLPIAQMYHVTTDNQIPYNVYGNKQDGPSYRGPSNSRLGEGGGRGGGRGARFRAACGIRSAAARAAGRFPIRSTPTSSGRPASGSGSVGGIVVRYDERTRQMRDVEVWPDDHRTARRRRT